jgi:hypothetical protein
MLDPFRGIVADLATALDRVEGISGTIIAALDRTVLCYQRLCAISCGEVTSVDLSHGHVTLAVFRRRR